eukprot:scaffold23091_cov20-Tisochrysis_lutea.AAC.1
MRLAHFASCRNILDLVSILMMIIICILHLVRVGTDPVKEDRAVAPMIAFELLLNYFKVRRALHQRTYRWLPLAHKTAVQ